MRVRGRLAFGSFQGALGWSERLAARGLATAPRDEESVARLVRATERAAVVVPGTLCLAQALVARVLLARRGVAAELRLGVARDEVRGFIAHAWLEWDGVRIELGSDTGRYTTLS